MLYSRSSSSTSAGSNAHCAISRSITLFVIAIDDSSSRSKQYGAAYCDRFARGAPSSSTKAKPAHFLNQRAGSTASNPY